MEAEIVLNLLDSYWYDLDLFQKSKPTKINQIPENPTSYNSDKTIPNLPTIHTNSPKLERMSSNHSKLSDSSYSSASPNSVLLSPRLQTIFSGKEIRDFDNDSKSGEKSAQEVQEISAAGATQMVNNNSNSSPSSYSADAGGLKGNMVSSRRRKKRLSKSLSDLEFEELKGFMDLGFVFSEEDKDSTLASILPGLQRLGNNTNNNNNDNNKNNHDTNSNNNVINVIVVDKNASKSGVSRPYLSEAWELLEKKKKKESSSSMLNWKVPASSDQIDMKGYLKSWAHTVASTVK